MAEDYSEKMDYYPTNLKSIQFEHDYCLNHLSQHNNNDKNVDRLNRFGKKFYGNINAVDKWADSIVLRESTGNVSKANLEREISILKVKCPFLPEQQIRGKVYKKFGIPSLMGGLLRRDTSFVGGSSSKKRSKGCRRNTKATKNLNKENLRTSEVSKIFNDVKWYFVKPAANRNKFWTKRPTTYDRKSCSIRSDEDLGITAINYVYIKSEASNYKIVDSEQFMNPTMLDQLSIEYESTSFLALDLQLDFRRVTSPVSSREISMNSESASSSSSCSHHFILSPKNGSRLTDLNGNIIQENKVSSLKLKEPKRKLKTELFPHLVGTNEIGRINQLYKTEDKFIKEDIFSGTNVSARQSITRNISNPDTTILDDPYSKQKWKCHYIRLESKSETDAKDVKFTNNDNNYKRAGGASKDFVSGNNAMIDKNHEGHKGSQTKRHSSIEEERMANSESRDHDFF